MKLGGPRLVAAAVLGVPFDASDADARRAYLALVKAHHPDRGGDGQRFEAVQAAWETWQATADGPPVTLPVRRPADV